MTRDEQHDGSSLANNWPKPPSRSVVSSNAQPAPAASVVQSGGVDWTASEFINHAKGASWYLILFGSALLLAAASYLLTHDKISPLIILVVGLLLGIVAAHQPRVLNYAVNDEGLAIGHSFHPFSDFKSFAVLDEGAFSSLTFMPLKRFSAPLTVYYDPEDEDRIIEVVARNLPIEEYQRDAIDQLIHRFRL